MSEVNCIAKVITHFQAFGGRGSIKSFAITEYAKR